jgi:FixJ family two-component response regulator
MISAGNQHQSTIDLRRGQAHPSAVRSQHTRVVRHQLLVCIVDDDESVRESLLDLVREFGFSVRAFSSAKEFLSSGRVDETSCLIVDMSMPGMSGPELQQELKHRGRTIPIIFITAQTNDTMRARVLEQGAAGFLLKPFSDSDLLAAVKAAL